MSQSLSNLSDFAKKWGQLATVATSEGISSQQIQAVYDQDYQRLQTPGDYAMSDSEALQSLRSVQQGAPTTAAPSAPFSIGSIPGYAVSDVKDLGVGLLGLFKKGVEDIVHPSDIVNQVSALWRNPAVLEDPLKALATPDDWIHPSRLIKEAANSPLLNALVPGVYDAGILAQYGMKTGIEQLLEHPASSLLDVLPIAGKGAELGATIARTGLTDDAVEAAREAAKFSPFDTSKDALKARKDFSEQIPSTIRRAALYGEKGLGSAVIRTLMGAPFDGESMGGFLTRKLGEKTGGTVGWESSAIGRMVTHSEREYTGDTAELSKKRDGFYPRHGITDPVEKDDFTQLVTHYSQDWQKSMGFSADENARLGPALDDFRQLVGEEANKDLEAGRLQVVTNPRTGDLEIRAMDGNDGRIVRASKYADKLGEKADAATQELRDVMEYPFHGDPAQAINEWFGTNIFKDSQVFERISPRETQLARQLFDGDFNKADWDKVSKLFGQHGAFARLRERLNAGDVDGVRRILRSISGRLRGKYALSNPALARLAPEIRTALAVMNSFKDAVKPLADARLAEERLQTLMDRYPEARFSPRMTELVSDQLMERLHGQYAEDPDFSLLYDMIQNGVWRGKKFEEFVGAKAFVAIRNSAVQTLIEERAAGLDPVWVPAVSSTEIPRIGQSGLDVEHITKSRSLKSRTAINPSAVYEPILGLIRKGAEDLEEKHLTELFYGDAGIKAKWGLTRDEIIPQAIQFAKGAPLEGTRARTSHVIERWTRENYEAIRPKDYFSSGGAKVTGMGAESEDEFLVPKSVKRALDANLRTRSAARSGITRTYLRGTQIFRWTLLDFSPRYQAHVWLGGMAMGLLREGPNILRYVPAAAGMAIQDSDGLLQWAKDGRFSAPFRPVFNWLVDRAQRQGELGMPPPIREGLAEADPNLVREFNYAAGGKMGKWLDKLMSNRGLNAGMELAGFGQNMWRSAAYLSGKARGGVEEGLTTALKVYADMDGLMPIERSIIKYVMPFYGWTRHILRYAFELPMDHPLRVAILSRMVNQEWEEWPQGYPLDLMYLFQIGGTSPTGDVKVMDIRQLDPLRSVTDVFTMAGFLSSLNPAFQAVAAPALGINPQTAEPLDLYPTLTLDQFYGTKTQTGVNPLSVLTQGIGGYIPEAQAIDHFVGLSSYTRWAKQNDPAAYNQQLWQALNFPWKPYDINLYQTLSKAEMDNYSLASDAVTSALQDTDPNGAAWKALLNYAQVPYQGWLVQPQALRTWAFDQVQKAGYLENGQATLPPSQVIVPPKAPRL